MTEPLTNKTVQVVFHWTSVQPDRRQWKPAMPVLEPVGVGIALDVPVGYVYSVPNNLSSLFTLTPQGMRWCIDQLEAVMGEPEKAKVDISDDEFEPAQAEKTVNKAVDEDDEWA